MLRRMARWPLLLASAGCGSAPAPVMEAPGVTAIAFVDPATLMPILDGAAAQIIHGPQGGYHVLVSVLAHGIWPGTSGIAGSPDDPVTTFKAFRASGAELTLTANNVDTLHVAYTTSSDGVGLVNRQLRLDTRTPMDLAMERLLIHVDVLDRDGKTASDEKHVVAIAPTN